MGVGHLAMFMSALFFGLNIPALKELMPHWFNGTDATFFRIVGATILFWIASIFIKTDRIDKRDRLIILLSGVFGLFLFMYLFNLSVEYSSPVDVSIIMTMPPVLVVLFSSIVFKSRITALKLIGILLSLGGALMLILIGHHDIHATRSMKGNLFAILSAIFYAFFLMAIKNTSEKYKPISLLRWVFLASCIGAIPVGLWSTIHSPIVEHPSTTPMLVLMFIIFFPTFISYLLMPIAIKRIGHELVAMYQYMIPVVATAAAIYLKLDKLYWDQPVAAVIIVAGVYLTSRANKRASNTAK